jgi:hypothetical protein
MDRSRRGTLKRRTATWTAGCCFLQCLIAESPVVLPPASPSLTDSGLKKDEKVALQNAIVPSYLSSKTADGVQKLQFLKALSDTWSRKRSRSIGTTRTISTTTPPFNPTKRMRSSKSRRLGTVIAALRRSSRASWREKGHATTAWGHHCP